VSGTTPVNPNPRGRHQYPITVSQTFTVPVALNAFQVIDLYTVQDGFYLRTRRLGIMIDTAGVGDGTINQFTALADSVNGFRVEVKVAGQSLQSYLINTTSFAVGTNFPQEFFITAFQLEKITVTITNSGFNFQKAGFDTRGIVRMDGVLWALTPGERICESENELW
jgi:hypothetical protein